jgi:hypothetical protein
MSGTLLAASGGALAGLGDRVADLLRLAERMLRDATFVRAAGGLEALAAEQAETPLRLLLEDYRRHAALTLTGCFAARYDLLRLLGNLAALRAREAREPALLAAPVTAPIIITGFPRSGSTFLHKLLDADPENRSPAVWETLHPLPRAAGDTPARRIAAVQRQLAAFARIAPGFRAMHPIEATSPQECTDITAHVLRSFRFEVTHHVPTYRRWLCGADHAPAYAFHRRFLQHLQHNDGRPRRWVLKCPDHVFALPALAAAYPDARIVMLHRAPLDVLASVAGLTAALRRPFSRRVDRAAIGRQIADDWAAGAAAMVDAAESRLFPPARLLHLHFRDIARAPLETVEGLYAHFGLPLSAAARAGMVQRIAALPRGGYGGLTHALADYGLDAAAEAPRFAAYAERFGVAAARPVAAAA